MNMQNMHVPYHAAMAYGSTPYVGMAQKKMAVTLKVHK